MMKRKKRAEIREKGEKLGSKGEEDLWWVVQGSTSAPSKHLHAVKRREITFCATSSNNVYKNQIMGGSRIQYENSVVEVHEGKSNKFRGLL